jgi:hypothetical protein
VTGGPDWTKRNTPTGQRPDHPSARIGQRSGDVRGPRPRVSRRAVEGVLRAIEARGASPAYHRRKLLELRDGWPTLADALAELLREEGRPIPPEWRRTTR